MVNFAQLFLLQLSFITLCRPDSLSIGSPRSNILYFYLHHFDCSLLMVMYASLPDVGAKVTSVASIGHPNLRIRSQKYGKPAVNRR